MTSIIRHPARRSGAVVALLAAAAAVSAPSASASRETTRPGVVYKIPVTLTDTKITIGHDRFAHTGVSRYPRGAVIRFEITNRGKRTYTFRIWTRHTPPMRPGGHDSLLVNWNFGARSSTGRCSAASPPAPEV
jgi:hypothetical protein